MIDMPPAKKTKKAASKKSRARFSAPTPPETSKEVVTNKPEEGKLAKNDKAYVEEIDTKDSEAESEAETDDSPRTITRESPTSKSSPLSQMLEETEDPEETDEPEEEVKEEKEEKDPQPVKKTKEPKTKEEKSEDVDDVEEVEEEMPDNNLQKSSSNLLLVGLIILLIVFAGTGWGLYLNQVQPDLLPNLPSLDAPTPTPEPTAIPEPTLTPAPSIVLEVLNGSGVAGAAADTQTKLEELGYTIDSIGNADKSDYETTEVIVASGFTRTQELLDGLIAEFGEATTSGELAEDATVDAQIILGSNWFE